MWIIPKTLSAFVPDMAGSSLESSELASMCEQSLMWRSKPSLARTWLQRLNKVIWMQHLSGRILKPSMEHRFVEKYTASLEVIPASLFPVPESNGAIKIRGISGRLSGAMSQRYGLFGAFSRTWQDIFDSDSTEFAAIWTILVTTLRRDCLRQRKRGLRTKGKDCSSWPTPREHDPEGGPIPSEFHNGRFRSKRINSGQYYGAKLRDATEQAHWLTPIQSDSEKRGNLAEGPGSGLAGQSQNWATPNTMDVLPSRSFDAMKKHAINNGRKNRQKPDNLREQIDPEMCRVYTEVREQANNWPTITTQGAKNNAGPAQFDRNTKPLNVAVVDGQPDPDKSNTTGKSRGQLNPAWVEQLMGLPPGWTNFDYWATELSRKQQN